MPSSPPEPAQEPSASSSKRGGIACRRCRRLRAKCLNEDGIPPCHGCVKAGVEKECEFLRGNSVIDRKDAPRKRKAASGDDLDPSASNAVCARPPPQTYSHPPIIAQGSVSAFGGGPQSPLPPPSGSVESSTPSANGAGSPSERPATLVRQTFMEVVLPPQDHLEEACEVYFNSYYQVGFLHKATFLRRLHAEPENISPFLLVAILAVVGGATPKIIRCWGSSAAATSHYAHLARSMSGEEIEPSLERIQAWYLLALEAWSGGGGTRSAMMIGIALRMALLLKLERKETYGEDSSTPARQILAESARRTLWSVLMADDCTSAGDADRQANNVIAFLTIPLPCPETDYDFGTIYSSLSSTPRNEAAPGSLMGNQVVINGLWCKAAKRAASASKHDNPPPWSSESEFYILSVQLENWRAKLHPRLRYSSANLQGHLARKLDMPFIFLHLVSSATHILLRRVYLPAFISNLGGGLVEDAATLDWWQECAQDLFDAAASCIEIAGEYASLGGASNFSPLMGFSIFLSAAVLSCLWQWPWISPRHAELVSPLVHSAVRMLVNLRANWPMAQHWEELLRSTMDGSRSVATAADGALKSPPSEAHSLNTLTEFAFSSTSQVSQQQLSSSQQRQHLPHAPAQARVDGYPTPALFDGFDLPVRDFGDLLLFTQGNVLMDEQHHWWSGAT